jgi:thiol-disulfide isomerase/thioredoxin
MAVALVVAVGSLAGCTSDAGAGSPVDQGQPEQNYVSGDGAITELAPADRADPIELKGSTLEGGELDLANLRGQVVVVNVWGSWCPPCRKEAPVLKKVSDDLAPNADSDVAFVGIDTRDSDAAASAFLDNIGSTYPNIVDPDGVLLLSFRGSINPQAIPSTLVLDREGRVAARVIGEVTEGTLRSLVSSVVAEQPAGSPTPQG